METKNFTSIGVTSMSTRGSGVWRGSSKVEGNQNSASKAQKLGASRSASSHTI